MKKNLTAEKGSSSGVPRGLSGYLLVIGESPRRRDDEQEEDLGFKTERNGDSNAKIKLRAGKSK